MNDRLGDTEEELGEFFSQEWNTYKKVVRLNFLSHVEIATELKAFLQKHAVNGFSFLELGCGDSLIASQILKYLPIVHYIGVDLSDFALSYAKKNMEQYDFKKEFVVGDLKEIVKELDSKYDFIVAGYSVHHLLHDDKLELFKNIRSLLKDNGYFIIYDSVCSEGESRETYLKRQWDIYNNEQMTDTEKNIIYQHLISSDHPESFESLCVLAQQSGFLKPQSLLWDRNRVFNLSILPVG
jgi:SAM-dependent methyltransferase